MSFIKWFFSWQLWLSFVLAAGVLVALWFGAFKWLDDYSKHGENISMPDLMDLDVFEAIELIKEKGLRYEIDSFEYKAGKPHNAILEFYPGKEKEIKEGRTVFIKSNPHNWPTVELPEVKSKSFRLARLQIESAGLEIGDTIYIKDIAKDAILKVLYKGGEIEAGKKLPRFSEVDLVLGTGPTNASVPDLYGLSIQQVKTRIERSNFSLGKVNYIEVNDTLSAKVFYQYPFGGDIYEEFNDLVIWVSNQRVDSLQDYIGSYNREYNVGNSGESKSIADLYKESYQNSLDGLGVEDDDELAKMLNLTGENDRISAEDSLFNVIKID